MSERLSIGTLELGDSQGPIIPQVLPAGSVPADVAIQRIADLYRVLQTQSMRMISAYGYAIPCDVQVAHNKAALAYQTAAQSVFNQILAQNPKYEIVQYVYGADGQLKGSVKRPRPVMPGVFSIPGCPNNAPMAGALAGVTPSGDLGLPALAWILIVIVIGATAVEITKVVIKNWPGAAIETAKAEIIHVQTQLDCVERLIRDKQWSREAAVDACKTLGKDSPQAPSGFGSMGTYLILVGVAAVGYVLYRAMKSDSADSADLVSPEDIKGTGFAGSRFAVGSRSGLRVAVERTWSGGENFNFRLTFTQNGRTYREFVSNPGGSGWNRKFAAEAKDMLSALYGVNRNKIRFEY